MRKFETAVLLALVLTLVAVFTKASGIELKARLAQVLIAQAWQRTLDEGAPQRPWPWADTWPVAKLQIAGDDPVYVLESTSGEALAFGPGRLPYPGEEEVGLMIAGHRDTHFRFLQDLKRGEQLTVQGKDGLFRGYRVTATRVVDSRREMLRPPSSVTELVLISCYPFDALRAGGPMRYVVYADSRLAGGAGNAI